MKVVWVPGDSRAALLCHPTHSTGEGATPSLFSSGLKIVGELTHSLRRDTFGVLSVK